MDPYVLAVDKGARYLPCCVIYHVNEAMRL